MNNCILPTVTDSCLSRSELLDSFHAYFNSMRNPAGFTINLHPKIRRKINGKWVSLALDSSIIENFWDYFNGELLHLNYYSYERKMNRSRILAFANVERGKATGIYHFHGAIDNHYEIEDRVFRYCILSAFKNANYHHKIISGDIDLNLCVDIGWVDYVFKDKHLCYPLIAK